MLLNKNITLAIDEDLLAKVRIIAAEERTSVNAIVRDALVRKVAASTTEQRRKAAARCLVELSRKTDVQMPEGWKFDREAIYAERLSGHEYNHIRSDEERSGEDG